MDPSFPPAAVPPRPDIRGVASSPLPLPPPLRPFPPAKPKSKPWVVIVSLVVVVAMVSGVLGTVFRYDPAEHRGEYSFLETIAGSPVRWDPCAPIHYVVNLTNAPSGSLVDVQAAVATISAATGIRFIYDGPSDEVPEPGRLSYQPDRYPGGWAPVLIAWVDPATSGFTFKNDKNGRTAIGIGGPLLPSSGPPQFVSGFVVLNDREGYPEGFGSPYLQGSTILHELGHVLGLGHVKAQGELMEFAGGGMSTFGPGDLEGLKKLGRPAGCLIQPSIP